MEKGKATDKGEGSIMMNGLLILNWIAFILVTAYAIYLFTYVVKTRYEFIKMGKKWNSTILSRNA